MCSHCSGSDVWSWRDSAEPQRVGAHQAGPGAADHMLLPDASGEVQDALDTSRQMVVTQLDPMMVSLLLQPSENNSVPLKQELSFLNHAGRKESQEGLFLLSHF